MFSGPLPLHDPVEVVRIPWPPAKKEPFSQAVSVSAVWAPKAFLMS
jgi:hypothetical protein